MIFSFSLALTLADCRKKQLAVIGDLIYAYEKIIIMLSSTNPETSYIISNLKRDKRLSKYDFEALDSSFNFDEELSSRIGEDLDILGKYDNKTQLARLKESVSLFKLKEREAAGCIEKNTKLYFALCLCAGGAVSLFII